MKKAQSVHADGPASPFFSPIRLKGNAKLTQLKKVGAKAELVEFAHLAPTGSRVFWGIPFSIDKVIHLKGEAIKENFKAIKATRLVFMHTTPHEDFGEDERKFIKNSRGQGLLNEHLANYVMIYEDGSEACFEIRRRHQVGMLSPIWGENCFQSVRHKPPIPVNAKNDMSTVGWGVAQTNCIQRNSDRWTNWLCSWKNPHPRKKIKGIRFEPLCGSLVISAFSFSSKVHEEPLRWQSRSKALLKVPKGITDADLELKEGWCRGINLDLGQIISLEKRLKYPNSTWSQTHNNQVPHEIVNEVIVEYTAHPDAQFHLKGDKTIPVKNIRSTSKGPLRAINEAKQMVHFTIIEKKSRKPVPVKLHLHGDSDEYLTPNNRHRYPNHNWFEDYSVDFLNQNLHKCTYIDGEAQIKLPLGKVYLEVSKGFEIKPIRKVIKVGKNTTEVVIEIEKVLKWREKGWVTADTHVHFISPSTAMFEGAAEDVNVINLLASQWGELMTNVGDFDGKSTYGSKEAGGDGEYLVRVGTENRQQILGHISLIGYQGPMIVPMTTGGPNESALGDPVEVLLLEWARQCRKQGGIVVLPHFPNPRAEHVACVINGDVDGIEMCSWGDLYTGINPYSLSDWYRYLNCGYQIPLVAGTDKMHASYALGTIRTYSKVDSRRGFSFDEWKKTIERGYTFVSYGPLIDFNVDGKVSGQDIQMSAKGGHVDISWNCESVTTPMTSIELIVNGELVEKRKLKSWSDKGRFRAKLERSSWIALLIRGKYRHKPEMIAAHTSAVFVKVKNSHFFSKLDAVTMLEQLEGSMAYLDTVSTKDAKAYRRMRLELEAAHRKLHNRMHKMGYHHHHSPVQDHAEHHHK